MKQLIRLLITLGLTFGLGYVMMVRLGERKSWELVFSEAKLGWLVAAIVWQAGFYLVYSRVFQLAMRIYGVNWRLVKIAPLLLGSIFINLAAPSGGLAGAGLFAKEAKKENQSGVGAMAGYLLVAVMEFVSLLGFLLLSFVFLRLKRLLYWYEIIAGLIFLGLTIIFMLILWLAANHSRKLHPWLLRWQKWRKLKSNWAFKTTNELSQMTGLIKEKPRQVWRLLITTAVMHGVNAVGFFLIFLAAGKVLGIEQGLIGYSLTILFLVVSVTPQGVGVVEGLMPVIMSSLGVNLDIAVLGVLGFRVLSLWLPAILGMISLNVKVIK